MIGAALAAKAAGNGGRRAAALVGVPVSTVRGWLRRFAAHAEALAEREHAGPGGERVRVARNTIDRWIRAWRAGGFDALVPATRRGEATTPAATMKLAVGYRWGHGEDSVRPEAALRHGLGARGIPASTMWTTAAPL